MKKETLSEAALKYSSEPQYFGKESGFIAGAKWQQERMYSEEDLRESFIEGYKQRAEKSDLIFDNASRMYAIHLFKQFKKK